MLQRGISQLCFLTFDMQCWPHWRHGHRPEFNPPILERWIMRYEFTDQGRSAIKLMLPKKRRGVLRGKTTVVSSTAFSRSYDRGARSPELLRSIHYLIQ